MILINNVSDTLFSLNGREYAKIFLPLAQGADSLSIYNAYDTRFKLLDTTDYTEIEVDGVTYASRDLCLSAISAVIFAVATGGGGGGGAVDSVFGRTGVVSAVASDYAAFYSQLGHTHVAADITDLASYTGFDSRYYTQSAADAAFAPISHTHTASQITDLAAYTGLDARYYTEGEVDSLLSGKVDTTRTLTAGTGLSGGGTLAANRTFSVDLSYFDGFYPRLATSESITGAWTFTQNLTAASLQTGSWTIDESGTDLVIKHNGNVRFKLSSTGTLSVEGDGAFNQAL